MSLNFNGRVDSVSPPMNGWCNGAHDHHHDITSLPADLHIDPFRGTFYKQLSFTGQLSKTIQKFPEPQYHCV